jgi:tetratricopeptide (TPR) repeat protein
VEHCTKWYGIKEKPHYGTVFEAGRKGLPEAQTKLIRLANDQLSPSIVRATALSLLRSYPNDETLKTFEQTLVDPEPLVRHTAIHDLARLNPQISIRSITPLLYDPVKAARIQAAMALTSLPRNQLNHRQEKVFNDALEEYQKAMEHVGDFAHSRFNLGNMHMNLGNQDLAEKHYKAAIQIDNLFYPAKVNLGMLYNSLGKNYKAEIMFREVVNEHPSLHDVAYSLGLLLVERGNYRDAAIYLKQAADSMPERARVHYNLGLLLQRIKQDKEAELALIRAHEIDGDHLDYLYALADFYLKRKKPEKARAYAEQIVAKHPQQRVGYDLLRIIEGMHLIE